MSIDKAPPGQQFCGRDQVAQAQSWKEHFAKGADREHPPGMVQPLQRHQRAPTKVVTEALSHPEYLCPMRPLSGFIAERRFRSKSESDPKRRTFPC